MVGEFTGMGQGSIGILIFAFLVEIDPRFRFAYIYPNAKKKYQSREGNENE
jgi:hypothetical protein